MAKINLTAIDFDHLINTGMEWGIDWKSKFDEHRFEGVVLHNDIYALTHIYWVNDYTSLILCRSYLEEHGYDYQPFYDLVSEEWCFLTEFVLTTVDDYPVLKVIK